MLSDKQTFAVPEFFEHQKWFSSPIKVYEMWGHFLWLVRLYFHERGYFEAPTPSLVSCPGTEPSIHFVQVVQAGQKYLASSPEINLKKVMALGFTKIFEIKTVFRQEDLGLQHLSEFKMLEWYRTTASLEDFQNEVFDFFSFFCDQFKIEKPQAVTKTVAQFIQDATGLVIQPKDTLIEYRQHLSSLGLYFSEQDSVDDLFFRLWLDQVEKKMDPHVLYFVRDYPPFQSAYAQICSKTGWGQRMETYWQGLEISNAFVEVIDADEQELRMKKDNEMRRQSGKPAVPIDEAFLEALRYGFPPTCGIALGLERLFMALFKISDIRMIHNFKT